MTIERNWLVNRLTLCFAHPNRVYLSHDKHPQITRTCNWGKESDKIRDGPLENLWGGGGGGGGGGDQKNSYKEFDNEKKFLRLENPPSPHNFSNGPSLRGKVQFPALR